MDLKVYYQKIRDLESKIKEAFPVVVSLETSDGGKPGTLTEVTKSIAAKMIVDGFVRLAEAKELKLFQEAQVEAKRLADQIAQAAKVQLTVLPTSELNRLRSAVHQEHQA